MTSASSRARVAAMAGRRCSHGPNRHQIFQLRTRSRVSMASNILLTGHCALPDCHAPLSRRFHLAAISLVLHRGRSRPQIIDQAYDFLGQAAWTATSAKWTMVWRSCGRRIPPLASRTSGNGTKRKLPGAQSYGRCWFESRHRRRGADPTLVDEYTT